MPVISIFFMHFSNHIIRIIRYRCGNCRSAPLTFPNSYWYPNATRFIYHTIHEFPIYSWTVADLHGHVLDIPFVLLTIAFLFSLLLMQNASSKKTSVDQTFLIRPGAFNFYWFTSCSNVYDKCLGWCNLLAACRNDFHSIHGQKIAIV